LEITGSVSTLNLYRVSTILDVALVATTVLLPSFLSRRCVSLTNTFFSCCYFGCFWIIFYYRLLYGIVNKYRSMCWIQWIVVYGRGNCLQCCCDGTYAYHRVVQVMTLQLSPVVVCKCPVSFLCYLRCDDKCTRIAWLIFDNSCGLTPRRTGAHSNIWTYFYLKAEYLPWVGEHLNVASESEMPTCT